MIHFINTHTKKVYAYSTKVKARIFNKEYSDLVELTDEQLSSIQVKQAEASNKSLLMIELKSIRDEIAILEDIVKRTESEEARLQHLKKESTKVYRSINR